MRMSLSGATEQPTDETDDFASAPSVAAVDVAALYRSEAPRLRRLISVRVHRKDQVQDLLQRVFLRMLGLDRNQRDSIENPRAYLTRIAGNLLRDEARAAFLSSSACHVSADSCVLATADPHGRLEARDMLERVDAAILELPPRTREIFMAHRFEDMTYAEIASDRRITVKAVEKHISLALQRLHHALGSVE